MLKKILAVLLAVLLLVTALPALAASGNAECPQSPDGHHHEGSEKERKNPTCTESGYVIHYCFYCRKEIKKTLPALGHDWGEWVGPLPTCTESTYRTRTCRRDASHIQYQMLDARGHKFGDWYVVKEPTLTEEGLEEHKCSRCGLTESRPIPKLNEDPVPDPDPDLDPDPDPDPDPVPDPDDYSLSMLVHQKDPNTDEFLIGDILDYEHGGLFITYDATVVNTGKKPVYFREYNVGPGEWIWNFENAVLLEPGESYPFEIRRIVLDTHIIDGSASEKYDGLIEYNYYAYGETEDGTRVCKSNENPYTYKILSGLIDWNPEEAMVETVKYVSPGTDSIDPLGYQLGEWVDFTIQVRNVGTVDIEDLVIYDSLINDGSEPVKKIGKLAVNETVTAEVQYQVTMDDVIKGYVVNQALAEWHDPDGTLERYGSNEVVVSVIPTTELLVEKTVLNAPPDGRTFFTVDDEIIYQITVKNNSPSHLTDVWVTDPLIPTEDESGKLKHYDDLGPGEGDTFDYTYTVTLYDCVFEDLTNIAYATGFDELDREQVYPSNPVTVPTGLSGDPFGVITDLTISKMEDDKPDNDAYYVLGEEITYKITVENNGEVTAEEGIVYDVLKKESGGEIGSFINLAPMDSRTYEFKYIVTEQDVIDGEVVNTAYCVFHYADGTPYYVEVTIRSTTGGETPTRDPDPVPQAKEKHCVRALTDKGAMAAKYSLEYCPEHYETYQKVQALVEEAETQNEAAIEAAWTEACALWKADANALYEEALETANGERRAALFEDRIAQFTYLSSYADTLQKVYGIEPYRAAQLTAEAWMNLCVDLCDLLNTAPETLENSVYGSHAELTETAELPQCAHAVLEATDSLVLYADMQCTGHAGIEAAAQKLIAGATAKTVRERAWRRVQSLWLSDLNRETNARYKAADAETRTLIAANRSLFDKAVAARQALLKQLYPAQPELAAEQIAILLSNQSAFLCSLKTK